MEFQYGPYRAVVLTRNRASSGAKHFETLIFVLEICHRSLNCNWQQSYTSTVKKRRSPMQQSYTSTVQKRWSLMLTVANITLVVPVTEVAEVPSKGMLIL